jgi:hypothetical protein
MPPNKKRAERAAAASVRLGAGRKTRGFYRRLKEIRITHPKGGYGFSLLLYRRQG